MSNIPTYNDLSMENNPDYLHPLEEILKPTYGVIIYQEQVCKLLKIIGIYSRTNRYFKTLPEKELN